MAEAKSNKTDHNDAELWAGKRRLEVVESLLAAKQPVTAETIETCVPTPTCGRIGRASLASSPAWP